MINAIMNEVMKLQYQDKSQLPFIYSNFEHNPDKSEENGFLDEGEWNVLGVNVMHCYDHRFLRLCMANGETLRLDQMSYKNDQDRFLQALRLLKDERLICYSL